MRSYIERPETNSCEGCVADGHIDLCGSMPGGCAEREIIYVPNPNVNTEEDPEEVMG